MWICRIFSLHLSLSFYLYLCAFASVWAMMFVIGGCLCFFRSSIDNSSQTLCQATCVRVSEHLVRSESNNPLYTSLLFSVDVQDGRVDRGLVWLRATRIWGVWWVCLISSSRLSLVSRLSDCARSSAASKPVYVSAHWNSYAAAADAAGIRTPTNRVEFMHMERMVRGYNGERERVVKKF